jgi:hypothetical protein
VKNNCEYDLGTLLKKGKDEKSAKFRNPSYTDRILIRNNTSNLLSKTEYKPVSYKDNNGKK